MGKRFVLQTLLLAALAIAAVGTFNYRVDPFQQYRVPKAEEIEADGQNLGEIQRLQQEKIEELFLYILQLNKKIDMIEKENKKLKFKLVKRK